MQVWNFLLLFRYCECLIYNKKKNIDVQCQGPKVHVCSRKTSWMSWISIKNDEWHEFWQYIVHLSLFLQSRWACGIFSIVEASRGPDLMRERYIDKYAKIRQCSLEPLSWPSHPKRQTTIVSIVQYYPPIYFHNFHSTFWIGTISCCEKHNESERKKYFFVKNIIPHWNRCLFGFVSQVFDK